MFKSEGLIFIKNLKIYDKHFNKHLKFVSKYKQYSRKNDWESF